MNSQNSIIEIADLSVNYGKNQALNNVNAVINSGDFVAITGPNGGGKSTLLKALLRLISPTTGAINYFRNGIPTDNLRFGYLPQKNNIDARFPITVEEVVASGLQGATRNWRGSHSSEVKNKISEILELTGMLDLQKRPIGSLSGGQLQRTLLGRAIIADPEVVVLDEPLSYVDRQFVKQIYHIVADLSQHSTIILVSHEMTVISELANRHWIVDHSLHQCHAAHHYLKTECE